MKPWKRKLWYLGNMATRGLQWGHGDEAVEELKSSLRPWLSVSLQWGHGDEAVEES